jgi:hypothetical protein
MCYWRFGIIRIRNVLFKSKLDYRLDTAYRLHFISFLSLGPTTTTKIRRVGNTNNNDNMGGR